MLHITMYMPSDRYSIDLLWCTRRDIIMCRKISGTAVQPIPIVNIIKPDIRSALSVDVAISFEITLFDFMDPNLVVKISGFFPSVVLITRNVCSEECPFPVVSSSLSISGVEAKHPVSWLHAVVGQPHSDWQPSPYDGKGHFLQSGP